ncbi:hypothetical protein BGZ50_001701, partial [Haplosporangium sp. Z 11]
TFNTNDDDLPWDFGTVRIPGLASAASTVRRTQPSQSTIRPMKPIQDKGSIIDLANLQIQDSRPSTSELNEGMDTIRHGPRELVIEDGFETIKAPPAAKRTVNEDSFKGSPQAQAGRQLTKSALLPVLRTIKSGEHSAEDLEALSVLEHGISDLNDINPSLLLAFFTQALTQIKADDDLMKQLEAHGGPAVAEVIGTLDTGKALGTDSAASSSASTSDTDSSDTTVVDSEQQAAAAADAAPKAETRSPASPVAEALYARWIEHLRSKWPIVA